MYFIHPTLEGCVTAEGTGRYKTFEYLNETILNGMKNTFSC